MQQGQVIPGISVVGGKSGPVKHLVRKGKRVDKNTPRYESRAVTSHGYKDHYDRLKSAATVMNKNPARGLETTAREYNVCPLSLKYKTDNKYRQKIDRL